MEKDDSGERGKVTAGGCPSLVVVAVVAIAIENCKIMMARDIVVVVVFVEEGVWQQWL